MAAVSTVDTAIIVYYLHNDISKRFLSEKFGKSREWMYQLAKRNLQSVFPDEQCRSWFDAGIKANTIMQEALFPEEETADAADHTPFWEFSRERRKEKAQLIAVRVKNLPTQRDEPLEAFKEEIRPAEQDSDEVNLDEAVPAMIIENITDNLAKKNRRGWRYANATLKFAYILRSYSNVCYEYLRKVFPLPSRQLLARNYRAVERELEATYQNYELFENLVTAYFDRHPLSHESERLQCSLSIDAFSMTVFQRQANGDAASVRINGAMDKAFSGKIEVETEQIINDDEEDGQDPNRPCNSIFLIVLNPFRWDMPSVVLGALPWRNGHADANIVAILVQIIKKMKMYNIDVRVIASDGDSGYSCLHNAVYSEWNTKRKEDFFAIFNLLATTSSFKVPIGTNVFRIRAFLVADPLHACKIARSRFLDHAVYLTPVVEISSQRYDWLASHKWYCDRTQLARMSDYYALSMFSPEMIIDCCKEGAYELAIYMWPWTALLLVIRVPFITIDCRLSLLHASFPMFQFFPNENLDETFKGTGIKMRYKKGSKGITFFETSYLLRVIHLIFALYEELLNGGQKLRLASFGSHINGNIIGRIRVSCFGNSAFHVIMRVLAKTEMRRVMQWDLGIDHTVRGRDNVGGTKLDAHGTPDLEGLDFANVTQSMIEALTNGNPKMSAGAFEALTQFLAKVVTRKREQFQVYPSNDTANSGIMARLIRFVTKKASGHQPSMELLASGEASQALE